MDYKTIAVSFILKFWVMLTIRHIKKIITFISKEWKSIHHSQHIMVWQLSKQTRHMELYVLLPGAILKVNHNL